MIEILQEELCTTDSLSEDSGIVAAAAWKWCSREAKVEDIARRGESSSLLAIIQLECFTHQAF